MLKNYSFFLYVKNEQVFSFNNAGMLTGPSRLVSEFNQECVLATCCMGYLKFG